MLRNSFYHIQRQETTASSVHAVIIFNDRHPIFDGHFPGQPVVPGVCMMQIVKDFVQDATQTAVMLSEGDNIKFLSVIDPRVNQVVEVSVTLVKENASITVNASMFSGATTFFKLKGIYI